MYGKPTSDYTYTINWGNNYLSIIDLNLGRMSVTNDAENVLTKIRQEVGDDIEFLSIFYRDSEEQWDTIVPKWNEKECESVRFISGKVFIHNQ